MVVSAAVLLATARGAAAEGARLTVLEEPTVEAATVRLGAIARLEGPAAEGLADVALASAPAAGSVRMLDGAAILATLRAAGLDEDRVTYTIPPAVRVRRAAQEVGAVAVRQLVESAVAAALGGGAADAVVRAVDYPAPLLLPRGDWQGRVIVPAGVPLAGRTRLEIEFAVDAQVVRTVSVSADIGRYGPVVVIKRPAARGEILDAADLVVDRQDLSMLPRDVLSDPLDAVGRAPRAPLLPFAPLRRADLTVAAMVKRGDVVLLVAERGGLRITTPGEVRADAGRGEPVRVVNRATRKEVLGRVLDASTVTVDF